MGDAPKHIQFSKMELTDDWNTWEASALNSVLKPQKDYEGINYPVKNLFQELQNIRFRN